MSIVVVGLLYGIHVYEQIWSAPGFVDDLARLRGMRVSIRIVILFVAPRFATARMIPLGRGPGCNRVRAAFEPERRGIPLGRISRTIPD